MKSKSILALSLSALLVFMPYIANAESLMGIAEAKAVKMQTISSMQQLVQLQKHMSKDQIVRQYARQVEVQAKEIKIRGLSQSVVNRYQVLSVKALHEMSAMNKSTIIALEEARLQQIESSDDYMFMSSRGLMGCVKNGYSCDDAAVMFLIITIPWDLATLPVTFIASAITGF